MEKTNTPIIAGTLSIISVTFGFLGGLIFAFIAWFFGSFASLLTGNEVEPVFTTIRIVYFGLGTAFILTAVLAVTGGICALVRRHWGWALAGAIIAIFSFLPLGILATIWVAMAKDEFGAGDTGVA